MFIANITHIRCRTTSLWDKKQKKSIRETDTKAPMGHLVVGTADGFFKPANRLKLLFSGLKIQNKSLIGEINSPCSCRTQPKNF
jgi:hypothetical protein